MVAVSSFGIIATHHRFWFGADMESEKMEIKAGGEGARKFTLWNGFKQVAAYNDVQAVLDFVKQYPEGAYTIHLAAGVGLSSPEVKELHEKWRARAA